MLREFAAYPLVPVEFGRIPSRVSMALPVLRLSMSVGRRSEGSFILALVGDRFADIIQHHGRPNCMRLLFRKFPDNKLWRGWRESIAKG